jgi:hypothetical protein
VVNVPTIHVCRYLCRTPYLPTYPHRAPHTTAARTGTGRRKSGEKKMKVKILGEKDEGDEDEMKRTEDNAHYFSR